MQDNILELAMKFIEIKSDENHPDKFDHVLDIAKQQLKDFTIDEFVSNGYKSILAYNTKTRPDKFKIILNGHLDVIPGKDEQYNPKIDGDQLYGVGSMDMKSNVACLIQAFNDMANQVDYPLGLQLVTDEQIGGFDGTKYQIDQGVRADFVLSGEASNFDIVYKAKGVAWLKITAFGQSAHGAYPWRGDNAILKMAEFIRILSNTFPNPHEEQWVSTINLSIIETTNTAFNKTPDNCSIILDVRFIPEEANVIIEKIKSILPAGMNLEIIVNEPALNTDKNSEFVSILKQSSERVLKKDIILRGAQGSSDARHYVHVNCPGVEFGPVGGNIASDNEWVSISSLTEYYMILIDFLSAVVNIKDVE